MTLSARGGASHRTQGVVSLRFCMLSKIFSRNLCITEIVLLMRISSWNFVREPKAMLWAHVQSFSLKFSTWMWFPALCIFARLFWRVRETIVQQPPGTLLSRLLLCWIFTYTLSTSKKKRNATSLDRDVKLAISEIWLRFMSIIFICSVITFFYTY